LPKSWTGNPARLAATHVPKTVAFATKPALAVQMASSTCHHLAHRKRAFGISV
jgi:hypothetical protein